MDKKAALRAVGARIRKLREAKGISQEDAARLAGIDRSYYGRIERGLINVSAVFLLKIARMLHCPVGSFFPSAQQLLFTRHNAAACQESPEISSLAR